MSIKRSLFLSPFFLTNCPLSNVDEIDYVQIYFKDRNNLVGGCGSCGGWPSPGMMIPEHRIRNAEF